MRAKYKAVLIDFYGTVACGDAEAVEAVCDRVVADQGLNMSARELAIAWGNRFFKTIDACSASGFRILRECETTSLIETCEPLCGQFDPTPYVDELFDFLSAPPLHSDAVCALEGLHLPLCCVSNADSDHLRCAIARDKLRFDAVVCSEDARSYKPDEEIFRMALKVMGCAPGEIVHVGDSLHSDVAGARRSGIDAIWVCRDRRIHDIGDAEPNYKIRSLHELHAILT